MSHCRCNQMGARLFLGLALLLVTYMALTPLPEAIQENINDKLGHALVFLLLAALTHAGWPSRTFNWQHGLPLIAYGIALECAQYFVPGRFFSVADMIADAAGILAWLLVSRLLGARFCATRAA
ncbi:VanZ family protein [Thiolapillus sp.]